MWNKSWSQSPRQQIENQLGAPEHLLFTSSDPEEVKSIVGRVLKPCQMTLLDNGPKFDARMHYIPMGDIALGRLRYGTEVALVPDKLEAFFLVQMPLTGTAIIDSGGRSLHSTPALASLISPEESTQMRWAADNDQFLVRISRSLLERTLVGQLGHAFESPLVFELGFAWQECQVWRALMSYLLESASKNPDILQHKLIVSQIEQLVSVTLLSVHQHNYKDHLSKNRSMIRPKHVRKAQEYLQAHAHEPIVMEQLAQIAGVSMRSLYAGFKDFLDVSPMKYLRDVRMERVRLELLSGEASSVTGVALRWGFAHMGRFSAEYKARFGETPSQSLKRI
ncbi:MULTISPECIES: AraC family transcriptional regulator [unclassified Serratia (in: enterobacteria)]|uniref:AraC family transcriptional regulator n=1 Tax=unclassified Serratia (in: enterobacteria) TaxID=2647522 RepID=UPI000506E048|nr:MULTISPECIES: AraC family transcriptional regulator [unclassified Serratia (in: enterobacteria)]KFK95703.1 transcriptional regulator [Serratia sp. Ag2]KFK95953.1 transcriptional regulator [Serratia sp. Ag1]